MALYKPIEHPNFTKEIKINSISKIELKAWPIIDSEKLDLFPSLVYNDTS